MSVQTEFQALDRRLDEIRARAARTRAVMREQFVARDAEIDLILTAAAAQEPLLFVGEPGTAKSLLVRVFAESLGVTAQGGYFEYVLTRFTEPAEILGPLDLDGLKKGRVVRRTAGRLPEARVAFLDEVFNANSAILNTLLPVVNERIFYQDGAATAVPLAMLFGATNDLPAAGEVDALVDRFVLKVQTNPVQATHFAALVDAGATAAALRVTNRKPWTLDGVARFDDLAAFNRWLELSYAVYPGAAHREAFFPQPVFAEFRRIVRALADESRVAVSDRRVVKLARLFFARAALLRGSRVEMEDLALLRYVANRRHELDPVAQQVDRLLGYARR